MEERPYSRRDALRLGAAALATLAAGCTRDVGEELPPNEKSPTTGFVPELSVHQQEDVLRDRVSAVAAEDVGDLDEFEAAIEATGLSVESLERERDVVTVEYVDENLYADGVLPGVAGIAGGYAALVDSGDESVALELTILDAAPDAFGSADVEREWALKYNRGELTAAEYGQLAASTIETHREPPEVGVSPGQ